jgi:hypothetical protein
MSLVLEGTCGCRIGCLQLQVVLQVACGRHLRVLNLKHNRGIPVTGKPLYHAACPLTGYAPGSWAQDWVYNLPKDKAP